MSKTLYVLGGLSVVIGLVGFGFSVVNSDVSAVAVCFSAVISGLLFMAFSVVMDYLKTIAEVCNWFRTKSEAAEQRQAETTKPPYQPTREIGSIAD
jgi:hypothetical protein